MPPDFRNGPLDGVRVLDLTNVIMGPFATHILADMGADVIKIEAPGGDLVRHIGPGREPGLGGSFVHLNRNKRSVALDLKREAGRAALRRLLRGADVFLHALRPQAIARLGFDPESAAALNPDIIYCGAYGFGAYGPYGNKPAYDDVIQAGSGFAALCAEESGGAPAYVPTVVCDKLAGQAIAYAILAGLLQRARGGGGQAIEAPMFETAVEFLTPEHMGGAAFDPPLGPFGYGRVLGGYRRPYRTRDGYACILPYSDRNWRDFFAFAGRPELAEAERFRSIAERARNAGELYGLIAEEAPKRTNAEWAAFCDGASIPFMPAKRFEELYDDPHARAVGLFRIVENPRGGRERHVRRPVNFSGAPFRVRRHAPALGEHTREVLAEAGLGDAEIAAASGAGQRRAAGQPSGRATGRAKA